MLRIDTPDDETVLLTRLRADDRTAAEALVRRHSGRMLAVARRLLRSEEESTDVVQDAFVAAFRALPRFAGTSTLGTWLHRIVVNSCLMLLRRRARRRQVSLDDWAADGGEAVRGGRRGGEQAGVLLEREEARAQVRCCIERLPEDYRAVLVLRDLNGLDTEQTAALLGIARGAVKTRLHRARQALRVMLEPLVLGGQAV
jgi:RNA polymerase sigma-70 factor (ECF subfamily)